MIRLVRAEFLKLRPAQVSFWMLLAAMAIAAFDLQHRALRANPLSTAAHDRPTR
jgi:hypothetical protein